MHDLVNFILEMRQGRVAADLNDKFSDVVKAVLETGGKGELTIKFFIKPSRMAMGGAVVEIEADHSVKTKKPELSIGTSTFFVTADGSLTREDPAQTAMFETAAPAAPEAPGTRKEVQ